MASRTLTVDELWRLPRVGDPVPAPDGSFVVVPVATWDEAADSLVTRLWRLDAVTGGMRALTSAHASSREPALSPDGRWLLFVRTPGAGGGRGAHGGLRHGARPQLHRMAVDGGEPECLTDLPLGVSLPAWFADGRRVAFVADVVRGAGGVAGTEAELERRQRAGTSARVTEDRVYRYWDRWLTDGVVPHLFAMEADGGSAVDLTPGSEHWLPFLDPQGHLDISPDGSQIAFTAQRSAPPYDPLVYGVFVADVPMDLASVAPDARPRLLTAHHQGPAFRPAYSPDGRWLVYGVQEQIDFYADRVRMAVLDRPSGRHVVLTERWDVDWASEWAFGPDGRTLVFTAEVEARRALFALDVPAAVEDEAARTPRLIARGGWHGPPRLAAGRVFATLQSLARPPEVVAYDLNGGEARQLTACCAEALAGVALGRVEEITVPGADGRAVQSFLVHPPAPAADAGPAPGRPPLPAVHLVHGGPHGSFGDQWHWRWNAQVFAAAGYLVALTNFHGSSGWGEAFTSSILGRWGDQPYRDLMAVTDELVARGLAHPERLAAAGGSYGGYLVAWMASQTDRFACLVNHAGVSDFQTQYASDVTQGRNRSMGGEPWDRLAGMDRYNPMRHAAGFRSPMLVLHGERDYRVPFDQGLAIYNVYKAMGLEARLVTFPDEGHWILKPGNSRAWYGEVLDWLARWLGPWPAPAEPRRLASSGDTP